MIGHAEEMLDQIESAKQRNAWAKILQNAFPKLVGGYLPALSVAISLEDAMRNLGAKDGIDWMEKMGCKGDDLNDTPISGRFYTHAKFFSNDRNSDRESFEALRGMKEELNSLGCHTAIFTHKYREGGSGQLIKQTGLFLPHMTLPKTPDGLLRRDIEGAAILLACLLDKGLVTEAEIPKDVDEEGRPVKNLAFSTVTLMMARTPDIQAKIRSLHGKDEVARLP